MRKTLFLGLLLVSLQATFCIAIAQDGTALKYNLKQGEIYNVKSSSTQEIIQNMMGQEIKMMIETSGSSDMTINNISNNQITVLYNIKDISAHTTASEVDTTIVFKDINTEVRSIMTIHGKPISSELIKSSENDALPDLSQVVKSMKLIEFPERALNAGESWSEIVNDTIKPSKSNPFKTVMKQDVQYTYQGKHKEGDKTYYKIIFSGPIDLSGNGNQMGMEMNLNGKGKCDGIILLNTDTKVYSSCIANIEIDSTVSIVGQENLPITMTQKIQTVTTAEKTK